METLLQDIRFGLRTLFKNKGFTFVAVLTLALAIGANTAIFSIVNPLLIKGLPVANADKLLIVGEPGDVHHRSNGTPLLGSFSYPLYQALSENSDVFADSYASGDIRRLQIGTNSTDPGQTRRGRFVTGHYFQVLGVQPALGRFFTESESDVHRPEAVAVLGYSYWQLQMNGDPGAVGKTIRLNNVPFTVIGVAQRGFDGEISGETQDVWVPMNMQPQLVAATSWLDNPGISWLQFMGVPKPGVTRPQAEASVNLRFQQLLKGDFGAKISKEDREAIQKQHITVFAGNRGFSWARDTFGRPMLLLMGIVGLVLVMACTNISNMLLARSSGRSREIALRVAIGAKPGRVVRQLVTESVLLAFLGGIAGLAVAGAGTQLLLRWVTQRYGSLSLDVSPDARVLGFSALLCLLTGVLFGLAPAFRALKVQLTSVLGQASRVSTSHGFGGFFSVGNLLVAAQFAVSMLVITGAGMMVRSLYNLQDVDLGYPREGLVIMKTDPLVVGYKAEQIHQFAREIPDALKTLPGVKQVAVSENGVFSGTEGGTTIKGIDGYVPVNESDLDIAFDEIGPGYFQTIGAQMLLGRDFNERDNDPSQHYAILNERASKFYFKDANPIGRKLTIPDNNQVLHQYEVVGVVRDVHDHSVREAVDRRFYVPFRNEIDQPVVLNVEIRTTADPGMVTSGIRQKMAQIAPGLPIAGIDTIDTLAQREIFGESMLARMSGMFGILALLLAAVGLYGLMSYMVVMRTKEIGIRLALGAQRSDIIKGILKQAMILAATGVAVGVPIALLSGHALKTTLYEVGAGDPLSLVVSVAILAGVALLASMVPALAAVRVDPNIVLRYE
ncbi:MAG TPA: ABC transporter permease [Terriglobales bacterium]|nr:ABC transporter permease [Terriglobales bacterium]